MRHILLPGLHGWFTLFAYVSQYTYIHIFVIKMCVYCDFICWFLSSQLVYFDFIGLFRTWNYLLSVRSSWERDPSSVVGLDNTLRLMLSHETIFHPGYGTCKCYMKATCFLDYSKKNPKTKNQKKPPKKIKQVTRSFLKSFWGDFKISRYQWCSLMLLDCFVFLLCIYIFFFLAINALSLH